VSWILRIGVAGCFIGHGAFGLITKAAWVPYFAVGGIGESLAWRLMPWVGAMDITVGLLAMLWPSRALLLWAAAWTLWTALLRPLSGEPCWEFLERAGNYGVPISILGIVGLRRPWFHRLGSNWSEFLATARPRLDWILRFTTFVLLVGHAGLGFFSHKSGLAHHYAALGVTDPAGWVLAIGAIEFTLAALILTVPTPALLLAVCLWKIATEALFLISGAPIWELIERFGSYVAPLALAVLIVKPTNAPGVLPRALRREESAQSC